MPAFGYDPYDAEWEHPDTGRTASTADDDWCARCASEIDFSRGGPDGVCECNPALIDAPEVEGVWVTDEDADDGVAHL